MQMLVSVKSAFIGPFYSKPGIGPSADRTGTDAQDQLPAELV